MEDSKVNSLTLAYIGDAVYEVYVRNFLIKNNIYNVSELQNEAVNYVSAKSQSKFLDVLLSDEVLTSEEIDIVMRARNHKVRSKPKHTKMVDYKKATAFEALIGYLYLDNKKERIDDIISIILRGD